jgi:GNAT superfamily N-acetyltransferase
MNFTIAGPLFGQTSSCLPILRMLPEWFGIEAALLQYAAEVDDLPTFLASVPGHVSGFLSLKQHNLYSSEIYVMGVQREVQRMGLGRALLGAAEEWLRLQACEYLQVKTLGSSNDDPGYAMTRSFYMALGFRPLEETRRIWNEENPCLILVKRL